MLTTKYQKTSRTSGRPQNPSRFLANTHHFHTSLGRRQIWVDTLDRNWMEFYTYSCFFKAPRPPIPKLLPQSVACTLSEAVPLPSRTHFVLYPFCWRKTIKEKLPNKKRMKKKQKLSIDISDDGDHGTSPRRERQPQSSWYLSQPTLRCACSFFSAWCRSSSKWAMANALPRPSGLGLGFSSGCFAHCLPSSDSPSSGEWSFDSTMQRIRFAQGPRMIRGSFEALAQTGFLAWYTVHKRLVHPRAVPHKKPLVPRSIEPTCRRGLAVCGNPLSSSLTTL